MIKIKTRLTRGYLANEYVSFILDKKVVIIWKKQILELSNSIGNGTEGNYVTLTNGKVYEVDDKIFKSLLKEFTCGGNYD